MASEAESRVPLAEVLRAFLRAETKRPRYSLLRALYQHGEHKNVCWEILHNVARKEDLLILRRFLDRPDSLTETELIVAARWVGEYGNTRIPLVPYTVGSSYDDRSHKVQYWTRADVPVSQLWIPYVNPEVNEILKRFHFNISKAAEELDTLNWPILPTSDGVDPIICTTEKQERGGGDYHLLDGLHRAVGAAKSKLNILPAYLGHISS